MKTRAIQTLFTVIAVKGCLFAQSVSFYNGDHLFPTKGGSMVTFSTGIPYLGIAEYAYGFSDRFSVGLIAGVTPNVEGYGVRIRGILYQPSERFRLYFRAPMFYYPQTKGLGGEPWVLAWPVISGEWKMDSGTRVSLGGGAVVASCFHSLMRHLGLRKKSETTDMTSEGNDDNPRGFMGGVWNTVHAGVAFPISQHIMIQTEASLVMRGFRVAGDDWVGGPPVIIVAGLSYSF
jgi:hypothetical protein